MKMKVGMIALLSILSLKLLANSDAICGVWMDDNKEGKTLFYKVSPDKYEAKLVWLKDSVDSKGKPLLDTRNPDKEKRSTPRVGLKVMQVEWDEAEQCYILHQAYDPKWGMTGSGKIWVKDDVMTIKAGKWGIRVTRTMDRVK
ncbi:MAG: DUF2147 domain-containing protein [Paludibacteraceae bacterium]|nr:DUF2147 domain-containing protein [Paludibacteraceae bacterium]